MKTPTDKNAVKPGHIMQIAPEEDHGSALRMLVVEKVLTWGVEGYIAGAPGIVSRTWNLIEPTGGSAVFDQKGKRLRETEAPAKHHP